MLPYQTQYMENAREIVSLSDFYGVAASDFDAWYAAQRRAQQRIETLKRENVALLSRRLFPALDDLHDADEQTIADLEEFADGLMDWKTNLDCGVYVLIHDSLLSLYRTRRDRNRIIKELYKLGMGLYYQNRSVQGIDRKRTQPLFFRNEMVFTEAGSYFKFFADIDDEETQGYIIRSLANIAICAQDLKRRIAVSARILQIVRDSYYRSLAPGLPWDSFLRRTNQQMSVNRTVLSRGNLTTAELAAVLESCHDVFEPEKDNPHPNIRWLWPYYEMEYSCGFVDLATTLERLEHLVETTPYDQYDISGLYGNVQLAIYYGRLMEANPALQTKPRHVRFLNAAYRKMMRTLLTFPTEKLDDLFFYNIRLVATDYLEIEGVESYRSITTRLMQRFTGLLFIRSQRTGDVLRRYCAAILRSDPTFFDDIDFLRAIADPAEKERAVLDYAAACGLYHDFGLIKMNLERLMQTRDLFEAEFNIYQLHTVSGYEDLRRRKSTKIFADVALGHHCWYNGAGGYPSDYVRTQSQYRQMTDVVAVAAYLTDHCGDDPEETIRAVIGQEHRRFSPLVVSFLNDAALRRDVVALLRADDEPYYRSVYRQLTDTSESGQP